MRSLLDRNLLASLALFAVGAVFSADGGDNIKDWIFPILATYVVLAIAAALLLLVVFKAIMKRDLDIISPTAEDRIAHFDVLVFFVIVLAYMFVMYGLGFWLSSFLMVLLTSTYLTMEKTRKNVMLAMVVPLGACIAAYFLFMHVFYVPFPKATWWAGFMS